MGRSPKAKKATRQELLQFGKLLRDRRNAAGYSRIELAQKAKLSDATIKFLETARHPPSRATLIRLVQIPELNLTWQDLPGSQAEPAGEVAPSDENSPTAGLNCFIAPGYDPLSMHADLRRFLQGAGGHLEQSAAYLDYESAAAYLAVRQKSMLAAGLRGAAPLAEAAKRVLATFSERELLVVALGAGTSELELSLVQELQRLASVPIELCMVDISQPLLARSFRRASELLPESAGTTFWAMQCNFHDLPLHSYLFQTRLRLQKQRLFCMLGGTFANLDNEPRFLQHSLASCAQAGDLLLMDVPVAQADAADVHQIQKHDKVWSAGVSDAVAAWLGGPFWRHSKDVQTVDFCWHLDSQAPVPGSYALDALAVVHSANRAPRRFSVFRFRRYDLIRLASHMASLGWDELASLDFGPASEPASLKLYRFRS